MNSKHLNILITSKADADEQAIYKYILQKFGKSYADKFRIKIIDLFKKLSINPTAGRVAKNDRSIRVFNFSRQNKVIYKSSESDLLIIRILNTKKRSASKY